MCVWVKKHFHSYFYYRSCYFGRFYPRVSSDESEVSGFHWDEWVFSSSHLLCWGATGGGWSHIYFKRSPRQVFFQDLQHSYKQKEIMKPVLVFASLKEQIFIITWGIAVILFGVNSMVQFINIICRLLLLYTCKTYLYVSMKEILIRSLFSDLEAMTL